MRNLNDIERCSLCGRFISKKGHICPDLPCNKGMRKSNKGYKWTEEQKKKLKHSLQEIDYNSGENHYKWKGGINNYRNVHTWLRGKYGDPEKCEYCNIKAVDYRTLKGLKPKRPPIQYALIRGKKHERNRENYLCLCYKCHKKYDS